MDVADVPTKKILFESDSIRRRILFSYWIVVLLALPLWWSTTSIQRLDLPFIPGRVNERQHDDLSLPLDVWVDTSALPLLPKPFVDEVEKTVRSTLSEIGVELSYTLTPSQGFRQRGHGVLFDVQAAGHRLDGTTLIFGTKGVKLSDVPSQLASVLANLLAQLSRHSLKTESSVIQFSPRYRLAFSLLNENASAGSAAHSWDIRHAVHSYLSASLSRLSGLHNFTIESQVQFYAPLAFDPKPLREENGKISSFGLTQEQLTVFVNSEKWTLSSSVSNDPVLHFLLFIPSAERRPLHILDAEGSWTSLAPNSLTEPSIILDRTLPSHSFIIPQWGGVVIYNPPSPSESIHLSSFDLQFPFSLFNSQLLALLGVPSMPDGLEATNQPLSEWQLQVLMRRRIIETTKGSKEVLGSIVKLVDQIEGMPVGQDVQTDFKNALAALDMLDKLSDQPLDHLMRYSSRAYELASRAFFNPGMLALLYFPAEHKLAVYMPLFAPVAVPLIVAVVREMAAWRKGRRKTENASHASATQ